MKVIYNQDQLERLAILGAKLSVSADGITRLDLEGVKMGLLWNFNRLFWNEYRYRSTKHSNDYKWLL